MGVVDSVLESLTSYGMLAETDTVLCALSGGADSVCLCHVLCRLGPTLGVQVKAAHYNHLLRGQESQRDADFVAGLCADWGLELLTGQGDVAAYAREHRLGVEEAARTLRYAFFADCAAGLGRCRVATAHQADDNAETLLLNLTRGAGLQGLGGIQPVRDLYIRPMLMVTRAEVDAYLLENGLPHVEDSSNWTDEYARNRLRHQVLPVLRSINPRFTIAASRAAARTREDEAFLCGQAAEYVHTGAQGRYLSAGELCSLPGPLSSRAVRLAASAQGVSLSQANTEAVLALAASKSASAWLDLGGGLRAAKRYDAITLEKAAEPASFSETPLIFGQWTEPEGLGLRIFCGAAEESRKIHGKFTTFFFKKEKICGNITVRPRKTGDIIHPAGRSGGKSLKKWMIEKKIPADRRGSIPVFCDEAGVLAVYGLGADARFCASRAEADGALLILERTTHVDEVYN